MSETKVWYERGPYGFHSAIVHAKHADETLLCKAIAADYKREMVKVFVRRAAEQALGRAS